MQVALQVVSARCEFAMKGEYLEELVNDPNFLVRVEVARRGYKLEKLVHDESASVRFEVAEQGYGLDILKDDVSRHVRSMVEKLEGAEVKVVLRNFGTYHGNLLLYMWEDRYEIHSGCYSSRSFNEWAHKCKSILWLKEYREACLALRKELKGYYGDRYRDLL